MNEITFASLDIHPDVLAGLKSLALKPLSPVEARAIPALLAGKAAVVISPTGSGKTFSYLVPILDTYARDEKFCGTRAIIVVPTVVLGYQVKDTLNRLAKACGFERFSTYFYASQKETETRSARPDVAIVTPRLFRPLTRSLDISSVIRVVFDEGDMILFDGFLGEMEQACASLPQARKSFFSASLGSQWLTAVKRMCRADEVIDLSNGRINGANIAHILVDLRGASRQEGLAKVLADPGVRSGPIMVFVSRKEELKEAEAAVRSSGLKYMSIAGDLDKRAINRAVREFSAGRAQVLVCTDYASRGLDLPSVNAVISYTLPKDQGYYFHRAGRSGRFDAPGTSYILCAKEDLTDARGLQRKGAAFTFMAVRKEGVARVKSAPQSHLNSTQGQNAYLTKAIAQAKREHPLGKVKPGYKKKIKKAVKVAKIKHRRKIIRTNLGKKDLSHGV